MKDTRLADRFAVVAANNAIVSSQTLASRPQISSSPRGKTSEPVLANTKHEQTPPTNDQLNDLRQNLGAANQARATLTTQVSEMQTKLSNLESQSKRSIARTTTLDAQVLTLTRRLKERDEELKGKSKLAEGAQDEMVGLELALNIAEEKVKDIQAENEKLKVENEMLVQRWLKRVGEEAERAGIEGGK